MAVKGEQNNPGAADIITAAQYNGLQDRIAQVLGTGAAEFGYGQALASSAVAVSDIVTAANMDNLRTDMNKAYTHQTGSALTIKDIAVGDVIGADDTGTSLTYANDGTFTFNSQDATGGFNDYLTAMTTIEGDKFSIAVSQSTAADATTDTRTTDWNSSVNMTFTVTFTDADQRRYFFNSGGEVRISGSLSSGTNTKDTDWATMLSNTNIIKFDHDATTADSGTGSAIGNYDLTSTYQTIFTKSGSGVYAENEYKVEAKENSTTQLEFRVTLTDNDAGDEPAPPPPGSTPIDEFVTGTITLTIGSLRASGTNVSVSAPTFSVTDTLE